MHRNAYLAIALVVAIADAMLKWLIVENSQSADSKLPLSIGRWITIDFTENSGIAFGLLQSQFIVSNVLVAVGIVVVGIAGWRAASSNSMIVVAGFGLVLGGALGNALDRAADGKVTDFLEVGRWPSFNLADAAITIGAVLIIAHVLRHG